MGRTDSEEEREDQGTKGEVGVEEEWRTEGASGRMENPWIATPALPGNRPDRADVGPANRPGRADIRAGYNKRRHRPGARASLRLIRCVLLGF